ncbi:winged helix-turn-helix transcriptional regulator [Actinopolymorpha pittospori]
MNDTKIGHDQGPCPIGRAGSLLGERWVLLILRDAMLGLRRFDEFRVHLGIADNILAGRLRRMVEAGLLVKTPYQDGNRIREEYRLTEAGADLAPVLRALADWGFRHTRGAEDAAPMRAVHVECGGDLRPDNQCTRCGAQVGREEEAWIRPWHSPAPVRLAASAGARRESPTSATVVGAR